MKATPNKNHQLGLKTKHKSKTERAGIIFPVARFHRYLKKSTPSTRRFKISQGASVYLASVIEYLVAEVVEQAGKITRFIKKKRISPRHLMLAIHQDDEMHKALSHVTIPGCGRPFTRANAPAKTTKSAASPAPKSDQKKMTKIVTLIKKKLDAEAKKSAPKSTKKSAPKSAKKSAPKSTKKSAVTTPRNSVEFLNERAFGPGRLLKVVKGSIVDVKADAGVNPTSGSPHFGGQVGSAMKRVGGRKLEEEVQKSNQTMRNTEAIVTGAANLPFSKIIHVNSPSWSGESSNDISNLEKTVRNILAAAEQNKIESIAIPSISSGGNGYPKQVAAETILRTINCYFKASTNTKVKQIIFVIYDQETMDVYTAELKRLA